MSKTRFVSKNERELEDIAYKLARKAGAGDIYCLNGELGAGKTVFARGFARGLGYAGRVTSPTFCILNEYRGGRLTLYHFDAYRVTADGMLDIGFEDYIYGNQVCVIEWADNVRGLIPENACRIDIAKEGDVRIVNISH